MRVFQTLWLSLVFLTYAPLSSACLNDYQCSPGYECSVENTRESVERAGIVVGSCRVVRGQPAPDPLSEADINRTQVLPAATKRRLIDLQRSRGPRAFDGAQPPSSSTTK